MWHFAFRLKKLDLSCQNPEPILIFICVTESDWIFDFSNANKNNIRIKCATICSFYKTISYK